MCLCWFAQSSHCHAILKKKGHSNRTERKKNQNKVINHTFHCWTNKEKLPCSNCRAALVSAELHIGSNELTSQERRCSIQTAPKWLMFNRWVTQGWEFDVGDWWVSSVGAPVQMHSRHRPSHRDCKRKHAGIYGYFGLIFVVTCMALLCFLIISLSGERLVLWIFHCPSPCYLRSLHTL